MREAESPGGPGELGALAALHGPVGGGRVWGVTGMEEEGASLLKQPRNPGTPEFGGHS